MSVKEVRQALGSWAVTLKPTTPRELLAEIEANKYGHIAIIPGRINPKEYGDGLLLKARYVGVFRATFKQSDETVEIKGAGMASWLGDEDDKGDIFETPVVLNAVTFPNAIRALLPPGGAITEGTLYSVPGAGTYTNTHQWETPRKALTYVTDTFSAGDELVEFRVNYDGTIDAGPISSLYNMTPKAILVKKDTGRDMRLLGLRADMSMDYDVEDLTTRIVLLAQGEGDAISIGSADAVPTGFKDLHGNDLKMTRLVSESGTPAGNAATRAQLQLLRWSLPRQAIQIGTDEFDVKGDFSVGDFIYVFDPDAGFYDLDNEVFWRGQPINPIALRVTEMNWNIRPNWTVAFRTNDGSWLDLSDYYKPSAGGTTLAVGDYRRTLAGNNKEPLSFRPNLPNSGADFTIPAAPAFTGFSSGVYESDQRTLAAVRAQWDEPLNLDASTITDGDHYEIRYRTNAVIGTQVSWDDLAGGYGVDFSDDYAVNQTNGWGSNYTNLSTASEISVSAGEGLIVHPTFNILRGLYLNAGSTMADVEVIREAQINYMPIGGTTGLGIILRHDGLGFDYYHCKLIVNANATVSVLVTKVDGGVSVDLGNALVPGVTHVASEPIWIRASVSGRSISMKVWKGGPNSEPQAECITLVDQDPLSAGRIGVWDYISAGSSNPANSATRTESIQVRSLTPDGVGSVYTWDDLGSWDALTSEPVTVSPTWFTAFVGWDSTAFTVMELSPGVQYEFQIRAVDAAKPPNSSAWSASTFVNTLGDVIAPSTPAVPEVAASMIAVQIVHALGKSSGGTFNLEQDIDHLDVHCSNTDGYIPGNDTKVGEMVATGAMVRAEIPAVGSFKVDQAESVWVKVVAVDRSGNKSAPSEAVQASIVLIDDAHISDLTVSKVTAGTITAEWIMAGAIRTAQEGARVELTSAGMSAYNGSGQKTVDISSADGSATFTGKLQTALNGTGVSFENFANNVYAFWSINDGTTGSPLDHEVKQLAYDSGGSFGQTFLTGIQRKSDGAQDGAKLLMTELATILSHQPASDSGKPEAYLSLGTWPINDGNDYGYVYGQGKFANAGLLDGSGLFWVARHSTAAGFTGLTVVYGPTTTEFMNLNVTIHATGSVGCWLSSETFTQYTVSWDGTAAHITYSWGVRQDAV